jgi:CheY-like chemotaxis protein
MRPTSVEGGRAALQALEIAKSTGHPFPLMLLDSQMPDMDGFTLAEQIKKDPGLIAVTIMMLTSAGHLGDAARCRELGISAYLVKPVRQTELLDGICQVLKKVSTVKSMPLVTRHSLQENKHRFRVLLAEDNAVNQTLAVRLLEKRGYYVIVAGNGAEAVQAFENNLFGERKVDRRPHPDHCHDRPCAERRSGAMHCCRDGRLHFQADPHERTVFHDRKHAVKQRLGQGE